MPNSLTLHTLTGRDPDLSRRVSDLARLRITVFRDYPYLYDGSLVYEEQYLRTYIECPECVIVLVCDGAKVVGASTGLPLGAETAACQRPFIAKGFDPREIFYGGESVLLPPYRGRGVYREFFHRREAHARALGGFNQMTFCGVVRSKHDLRRPRDYAPLDAIWRKFGYTQYPELTTNYLWKDLDEPTASDKEMVFWMKPLS
ncbi:MAG: GNAT family N-acetyltransferase [Gammaproteobacteria bacterium]|nr:GNAT family N-acetyltransferase [Gammaproteobacteria bacterium]